MSTDDQHSGLPTRAIHEAYLDVQQALRQYREARDRGAATDRAHARLQHSVLTLYELLRPHLRAADVVADYWTGTPPDYPGDGVAPDPDDGAGVLHVQRRTASLSLDGDRDPERLAVDGGAIDAAALETLAEWHDELGLSDDIRLVGVAVNGDVAMLRYDAYQLGLRQLDDWGTVVVERERYLGGFLAGRTASTRERRRVDVPRLRRAARELAQAADELNLLTEVQESSLKMIQDFDQSRQEETSSIDETDYSGEPPL